jgi:hypothetical protein
VIDHLKLQLMPMSFIIKINDIKITFIKFSSKLMIRFRIKFVYLPEGFRTLLD